MSRQQKSCVAVLAVLFSANALVGGRWANSPL